jgi:hypothetical protein
MQAGQSVMSTQNNTMAANNVSLSKTMRSSTGAFRDAAEKGVHSGNGFLRK